MSGETNLGVLLKTMHPLLQDGEYVFCSLPSLPTDISDIVCFFREKEGATVVIEKKFADQYGWSYDFVASWIVLEVHSSLSAVGLTAAFSSALASANISCNVIAGYYHDHIFVDRNNAEHALKILNNFASDESKI